MYAQHSRQHWSGMSFAKVMAVVGILVLLAALVWFVPTSLSDRPSSAPDRFPPVTTTLH